MQKRIVAAAAASLVTASAAGAATLGVNATAYSLGNDGTRLVVVASATGTEFAVDLTFAGAPDSLDGIDFRPETGQLYGYSDASDTVYVIDRRTGVATSVATSPGITNSGGLDIDFNPVADAFRAVNDADENVVFFPNAAAAPPRPPNTLAAFTPLAYAAGDPNEGVDPNVAFNAYTNSVPEVVAADGTTQYFIDSGLDILGTLANNTGVLTTIGAFRLAGAAVDLSAEGGFDIFSSMVGDNTAFALLSIGGAQGIYSFGLAATGGFVDLTFVADASAYGALDGFAITPSPVPLPAAGLLLAGSLGALAFLRRRRRAA